MFSAQEIIISSFYVYAAYRYLQGRFTQKSKTRQAMFLLLFIQVVIIALDITIIVIDLGGYLKLKIVIHSFIYSVKLELEFVVLNQLVEISKMGLHGVPSLNAAAVEARTKDPAEATVKDLPNIVDQSILPSWISKTSSDVDLESCDSNTSMDGTDFITTPQNTDIR
jgi:hypothetical protein